MHRNRLILFFCLFFISIFAFAQSNPYTGTWRMEYVAAPGTPAIQMELQISSPENNLLYPALLQLKCDNFSAAYELLLVKKSSRELGISKNKYPLSETPFTLKKALFFLNGVFDFGRDLKGDPALTIRRIQTKAIPASNVPTENLQLDKANKLTADRLNIFIKDADIVLSKINNVSWKDENSSLVLCPSISPAYFGIKDTIHLPVKDGVFHLSGDKKTDIVSMSVNGRTVVDMKSLNKKESTDDILLDTGLTTVILFADNFGNDLPSRGKLNFEFGTKKIHIDFNKKEDSAASFIVVKLYQDRDKEKEVNFQQYTYPGLGDKPLQENEKLIGGIVSTSHELKLAIWDDAVEDGDSISININGKWIAKGFPVKKEPQFITVSLKPGPNTINFIADNLGSIPPNTSMLEIIDGKKRRSYTLETTLGESNYLKIFYDLKPN